MTDDIPATIPSAIERAAQLWPNDEALVDTLPDGSTNRLNFTQLRDRIWQVAAAMVAIAVSSTMLTKPIKTAPPKIVPLDTSSPLLPLVLFSKSPTLLFNFDHTPMPPSTR